jgi:hypothetical protein
MKMEARFVTRSDGTIFIGVLSKNSSLKPDTVYEIMEILDTLTIREIGTSIVPSSKKDKTKGKVSEITWGSSIGHIMESLGSYLFLSTKEYENCKKG